MEDPSTLLTSATTTSLFPPHLRNLQFRGTAGDTTATPETNGLPNDELDEDGRTGLRGADAMETEDSSKANLSSSGEDENFNPGCHEIMGEDIAVRPTLSEAKEERQEPSSYVLPAHVKGKALIVPPPFIVAPVAAIPKTVSPTVPEVLGRKSASRSVDGAAARPGLTRNMAKKQEEELPVTAPRRTWERVLQLLHGTVQPEKCSTPCRGCGTDHPCDRPSSVLETDRAQKDVKEDTISAALSRFAREATAAPTMGDVKVLEARKKSAVYRNGATSQCSPMKKRSCYEEEEGAHKDKPEDVYHQTNYRTSMYRSAASTTPLPALKKKSLTRVPTPQVAKKPVVFNYWRIMYAQPSSRKHKIWEDDGTLAIEGNVYVVRASNGQELARRNGVNLAELSEDKTIVVGSKEVLLLDGITDADYKSKKYME